MTNYEVFKAIWKVNPNVNRYRVYEGFWNKTNHFDLSTLSLYKTVLNKDLFYIVFKIKPDIYKCITPKLCLSQHKNECQGCDSPGFWNRSYENTFLQ